MHVLCATTCLLHIPACDSVHICASSISYINEGLNLLIILPASSIVLRLWQPLINVITISNPREGWYQIDFSIINIHRVYGYVNSHKHSTPTFRKNLYHMFSITFVESGIWHKLCLSLLERSIFMTIHFCVFAIFALKSTFCDGDILPV